MKEKIVRNEVNNWEPALQAYQRDQDYDRLAEALKSLSLPHHGTQHSLSPHTLFDSPSTMADHQSAFASSSFTTSTNNAHSFSFSTTTTSSPSQWLDMSYKHNWTHIGQNNTVLFLDSPVPETSKIACFDLVIYIYIDL